MLRAAGDPSPPQAATPPPSYGSFEDLFRACRDAVYAYAVGMLRDGHAAEELVSVVFERAWKHRDQIDRRRGDARAWLFGIARNAALDELRRRRRHATPAAPEQLATHAGAEDDDLDPARIALRIAVSALPARDRELVALKFWAGLNNREIARVTGLGESNVGTRLARTIRDLRSSL